MWRNKATRKFRIQEGWRLCSPCKLISSTIFTAQLSIHINCMPGWADQSIEYPTNSCWNRCVYTYREHRSTLAYLAKGSSLHSATQTFHVLLAHSELPRFLVSSNNILQLKTFFIMHGFPQLNTLQLHIRNVRLFPPRQSHDLHFEASIPMLHFIQQNPYSELISDCVIIRTRNKCTRWKNS